MQWFSELLVWLLESPRGNLERHRGNNHGVWFHQTALAIALHVGDAHSAKMLANDLPWFLIDRQIELGMRAWKREGKRRERADGRGRGPVDAVHSTDSVAIHWQLSECT